MNVILFSVEPVAKYCAEFLRGLGGSVVLCCPSAQVSLVGKAAALESAFDQVWLYESIDSPELLESIEQFNPDYIFSIYLPDKVPDTIISASKLLSANFHPAPLPEYRSADANFWPLYEGREQTAVSFHKLNSDWDSGDLLLIKYYEIKKN